MRTPAFHVGRRTLLAVALVAATGATVLGGAGGDTRARPPSTTGPIPAGAFKPILTTAITRPVDAATSTPDFGMNERTIVRVRPVLPTPVGPTHVVRAGDTLWQIAAWHRADLDGIRRWNPLLDPSTLRLGARILVPDGRKMPARPKVVTRRASPATAVATTRSAPARAHRWPLPVKGLITSRFSTRHPALDIAAPSGTPVRAIARGRVTWAGWKDNGGGYVVVIRHPDGMVSTYNHNKDVAVRRGQSVSAGQRIARVGATGLATGPHLDLRIEMGGRLINPLALY